jgi:hypothetical protein
MEDVAAVMRSSGLLSTYRAMANVIVGYKEAA